MNITETESIIAQTARYWRPSGEGEATACGADAAAATATEGTLHGAMDVALREL